MWLRAADDEIFAIDPELNSLVQGAALFFVGGMGVGAGQAFDDDGGAALDDVFADDGAVKEADELRQRDIDVPGAAEVIALLVDGHVAAFGEGLVVALGLLRSGEAVSGR